MDALRQEGTLEPSPSPEMEVRPQTRPPGGGRDVLVDVRTWLADLRQRTLAIVDRDEPGAKDVHQLRLTTKRLRALWQMLRPVAAADHVDAECRQLAGAARVLAADRDLFVLREMLDLLREHSPKKKDHRALATVLAHLPSPREAKASPICVYAEFLRQRLHLGLDRVAGVLDGVGEADVLVQGAAQTYARAQRLGLKAYFKDRSPSYHRWRKWVKYLYYELEILDPEDEGLTATWKALDRLGKTLGASHDMANLRARLGTGALEIDDPRAVKRVRKLARRHERELIEATRPLAAQVFGKPPEDFVRQLTAACS